MLDLSVSATIGLRSSPIPSTLHDNVIAGAKNLRGFA